MPFAIVEIGLFFAQLKIAHQVFGMSMNVDVKLETKKNDPKALLILWEGEVWREVSRSLFMKDLIKIPSDLSKEAWMQQFALLEDKIGKRYAVYLLSQRSLLSTDLQAKLEAKGLCRHAARGVVEWCKEKKYLDDAVETRRLLEKELRKGRSSQAVLFKLRQRGVDEKLLREDLSHLTLADEKSLQKWIDKLGKNVDRSNPAQLRKLMAKLCRRGFSTELVFQAFDDIY